MAINKCLLCASLPAFLSGACLADFSGPYAPENWTFIAGPGGSLTEHTASTLIFQGGDLGISGPTDITVIVIATGSWSFDWSYTASLPPNTACFDVPYYLVNDQEFYLGCVDLGLTIKGSVSVPVEAGDVIGYRNTTIDGVFGPGTMTITNFSAPVPMPAASLALLSLGVARLAVNRQRGVG